jgi:hypothetical protein
VYADYIDVMNGGQQDYHWVDPYPQTLESSALLNMLNVRYIVVALDGSDGPVDLAAVDAGRTVVFQNEHVVVIENAQAFERAWVVHDVRPNNDGEGLLELAAGSVDGHAVAFIDGPLPNVDPLMTSTADAEQVIIIQQDADALTAEVTTNSAGLVVFSEIYEQGWNAHVDGESVEVLRTNHALRGVPVPAGEHVIELSYEPPLLRTGLWISGITSVVVVMVWVVSIVHWVNDRRPVIRAQ